MYINPLIDVATVAKEFKIKSNQIKSNQIKPSILQSTIRLLVEYGASVDLQTEDDATALVLAAEQGHLEVVKALVELGAAPDVKGNQKARTYPSLCVFTKSFPN